MLVLGLIMLTLVVPLLSRLPDWMLKARLQQEQARASLLTQARQTWLHYATGAVRSNDKTYPGKLPMPDFDGDGGSDGPIGISGSRVCMGFYPWKNLPASWRVAGGERLRVAVAERVVNPQQGNALEITAKDWRRATWLSAKLPDQTSLNNIVAAVVLEPATSSVTGSGTSSQCDYSYQLDFSATQWPGRYRFITLDDFLTPVVRQVARRLAQAWLATATILPTTLTELRLAIASPPGGYSCSSSQWLACWLDTIEDYQPLSPTRATFTFSGCQTRFTLKKTMSGAEIEHDGMAC